MRFSCSWTTLGSARNDAGWRRNTGVAIWACQLALQGGKRGDGLRGLEGPVAPSDVARMSDTGGRNRTASPHRQPAAPQDEMNECPASAPVTIDEWVYRLELGMRDRRLGHCGKLVRAGEGAQVIRQPAFMVAMLASASATSAATGPSSRTRRPTSGSGRYASNSRDRRCLRGSPDPARSLTHVSLIRS